ncbi:TPA: hypothetical protein RQO17_000791 [Klebsiella michiganensis]|uniref:Uncharacterized protein n=2 Tax=Klebsiella michiganensis TaxID=1134687 RepID=A0AB35PZR2_9ENTR|nr:MULTISPECIES: hypothetical protein [Klebsiella]EKV5141401.1 hypothetical protein [Klebsiella michiganensis]ELT9703647.1 hypothetical protein [Klebsiella michiganensis]ELT9740082.1 hypothetical protein [Klebsiella michiganensis]MBA4424779.1 hypothetical protein [Klebsiella michiganensis]MBD0917329.1 hypothetical protein [Klebsiella michiganensis]
MATLRTWERRYLFIFASQKRSMAKTQRVDERASLIYKTAFLLIQKIGPKVAKRPQKWRRAE